MRAAADALLARAGVTAPPAPLELLASLQGVVDIQTATMPSAGRLIPASAGYVIQVNASDLPTRQRFSIAHEICHTFFDRQSPTTRDDAATGTFDPSALEEYLCDIGAAHLLLHPRWLRERAAHHPPSLDRLFAIATACQASAEATARQVAELGVWDCSFVFWELGHRRHEREDEQHARLRVARVYPSPGAPFLPLRKSVAEASSIATALTTRGRSSGVERLVLGRQELVADCEAQWVGYDTPDGVTVPRVLSLLRWRRD